MILLGDINKGLRECQSTPGSILVDVRERTEFTSGHIAGAVNEPLSMIHKTASYILIDERGLATRS